MPMCLTATYGQTLDDVTLTNPTGNTAGTWAWVDAGTTSVGNVGSNTFKANFTPTDTANYNSVSDVDVTVTIGKANPTANAPTGLTATYGQTLDDVTLTNPTGNTAGTWAWVDNSTSVGNVGSNTFKANFTPDDTANYNSVSNVDVIVTVGKADPTATAPTATATYGQTLDDVTLTNPTGNTAGTWAWVDAGTTSVGNFGSNTFKANFTPTDTANYNSVSDVDVTVTVGKANAVAATVTANNRTYDGTEKPLVTIAGETIGGTLKFAVTTENQEPDTEAYTFDTTSIPARTNAGTYYVWYKAVGDENHTDSKPKAVTAVISPSAGPELAEDEKPTPNEGLTYTGDELALITGPKKLPEGYTAIQYSIDGGKTWTEKIPTGTKPGEYTVAVKYIGDDNHDDFTGETMKVTIQGGVYSIFSATGAEHVIKDGKDAIITVKRDKEDNRTYKLYTDSAVDGEALPKGSSTTAEGSLVLTLKAAYLDTLSAGDHKVTISFQDGSVDTTLKILAEGTTPTPTPTPTETPTAKPKPAPKTGDSAPLALWLGLILLGLAGLGCGIGMRKAARKK